MEAIWGQYPRRMVMELNALLCGVCRWEHDFCQVITQDAKVQTRQNSVCKRPNTEPIIGRRMGWGKLWRKKCRCGQHNRYRRRTHKILYLMDCFLLFLFFLFPFYGDIIIRRYQRRQINLLFSADALIANTQYCTRPR